MILLIFVFKSKINVLKKSLFVFRKITKMVLLIYGYENVYLQLFFFTKLLQLHTFVASGVLTRICVHYTRINTRARI